MDYEEIIEAIRQTGGGLSRDTAERAAQATLQTLAERLYTETDAEALDIDGLRGTVWHSDWYATPGFGNLDLGTGLIVDMGRPVMVTAVRVALGAARARTPRSASATSRPWRSWPRSRLRPVPEGRSG
jgi:hypothetical protein